MREILPEIDKWLAQGKSLALATVVQTWRSAPRRVGAHMVISADGEIAGSVSGGCVEGAVAEVALGVIRSGQPELLHFGVADETAWDVGLACGGEIDVFVAPLEADGYNFLHTQMEAELPVASGTVISGSPDLLGRSIHVAGAPQQSSYGSLDPALDEAALQHVSQSLSRERNQRVSLTSPEGDPLDLFINVLTPSPTLVIIGGVHIAIALTKLAKPLGYRVIIIDPRRAFGNTDRFPHADLMLQSWPDEAFQQIDLTSSTAVATLTHDPKIDDPALITALDSPVFYIGALGSRTTQANRRARLIEAGVTEEQLAKIKGPIGLDIGARTPEEIALAIMAEIVSAQNGKLA